MGLGKVWGEGSYQFGLGLGAFVLRWDGVFVGFLLGRLGLVLGWYVGLGHR